LKAVCLHILLGIFIHRTAVNTKIFALVPRVSLLI